MWVFGRLLVGSVRQWGRSRSQVRNSELGAGFRGNEVSKRRGNEAETIADGRVADAQKDE